VSELRSLLSSSHPGELQYGLVASRFDRHAEVIPEIVRLFPRIPDRLKAEAIRTLEVLTGQPWSIAQALGLEKRPTIRGIASKQNCDLFKGRTLASFHSGEFGALELCLRDRARSGRSNADLEFADRGGFARLQKYPEQADRAIRLLDLKRD
jgi:hypothetical protein